MDLQILSEKSLHQRIDPDLLSYCPSMDLLALVSADQQILIYRLNGQRVYGASQKIGSPRVERICWKPNGQLLATSWSDGSVRLVGAESSKIVHQFSTGDEPVSGVTCTGWASNLTSHKSRSTAKGQETWQDLLAGDSTLSEQNSLDLPRDLALIDIETSLPKLSVLTAGGGSEDVFCSRSSLDALFRPFDPKDKGIIDVMVVGTKDGNIHLSIYDSFVVGAFTSPVMVKDAPAYLVLHASLEQYWTHSLLMRSSVSQKDLYFVPMDLRFVSTSSSHLSLLASRSTALQNLLRYIHQVQVLMVNEWKSTQELPSKFIRNINDKLSENSNHEIVQVLYHSVATGHTFPAVREWLMDELAERGHKRWDKAVTTGLENLRRLVHENMLPALDRCSVILSRFAGIAKFQGHSDTMGFSSQTIGLITDTVACLHLVSSKILIQVVDELDLFTAFSSWLRYEIDRLATDTAVPAPDETAEKEALIDHSKVLLYIRTAMTNSPLETFLGETSVEDYQNDWSQAEQWVAIFDLLDKQIQKQEQGLPYLKALPRVELLGKYLTRQAKIVFGQIAEAEKRNVLFGKANAVGVADFNAPIDMIVVGIEHLSCQNYIAFVPEGHHNRVQVVRISLSIENGISSVHSIEASATQLGKGRIKDIKFLDSDTLLVLWEADNTTRLLSVPYKDMAYTPASGHMSPTVFGNDEVFSRFTEYRIVTEGLFVPEKMAVRKLDKLKVEMQRIILLGKDGISYKVCWPADRQRQGGDMDVAMP